MQWNRSSAIGLALASCTHCGGHGMRELRRGADKPCPCVYRAIFRACYNYFQECATSGEQPGRVSLESCQGPRGYRVYSLKREEFMADFCLAARRVLAPDEYRLFRYSFLLGADWKLCSRYLGIDRAACFRNLYRIEAKLGKYFAELEPYPLYPIDEYMGGIVRTGRIPIFPALQVRSRKGERLPMTA